MCRGAPRAVKIVHQKSQSLCSLAAPRRSGRNEDTCRVHTSIVYPFVYEREVHNLELAVQSSFILLFCFLSRFAFHSNPFQNGGGSFSIPEPHGGEGDVDKYARVRGAVLSRIPAIISMPCGLQYHVHLHQRQPHGTDDTMRDGGLLGPGCPVDGEV